MSPIKQTFLPDFDKSLNQWTLRPTQWQGNFDSRYSYKQWFAAIQQIHLGIDTAVDEQCVLYCEDPFWFSAAFIALMTRGIAPVLPPGDQPALLKAIAKHCDRALIIPGHQPESIAQSFTEFATVKLDIQSPCANMPQESVRIQGNAMAKLATSGSTGERSYIQKSMNQLFGEVQVLNQTFAVEPNWLASVSHQHIYGLLFRVLWPLATSGTTATNQVRFPSEIAQSEGRFNWIASPATLSRIAQSPNIDSILSSVATIFSSGGALDQNTAQTLSGHCALYEVYGSTETGGVAWRDKQMDDKGHLSLWWTPFVGTEFESDDNGWNVRSVHTDHEWIELGDKLEFRADEQKFRLLGRKDRIAKIGEKRVSLDEIEAKLQSLDWIEQAKAFVLNGRRKNEIVAVIQTARASAMDKRTERLAQSQKLRSFLQQYFDSVSVPRRYRYVSQMPTNAQGKTPLEMLRTLFEGTTEPDILAIHHNQDETILLLQVREDCKYFHGHFDSFPLLPGVVQIQWAVDLATRFMNLENRLGEASAFAGLEAIKFRQMIAPGAEIRLSLSEHNCAIRYEYSDQEQGILSSGRIKFDPGL